MCLDEHIEAPFKMAWSQNGRSNQPTHPPTNHCLGGLTGPSWFSTFPHPTSYGLSPPTPLHQGHCLGLVNELLGGAQETRCIDGGNAASDGDSLCTRGSCPESLLWRCKWQQNNGHCLVARREVIQGVDVDIRGWDITYQYSLCLNTATVSGCIWSKYILV